MNLKDIVAFNFDDNIIRTKYAEGRFLIKKIDLHIALNRHISSNGPQQKFVNKFLKPYRNTPNGAVWFTPKDAITYLTYMWHLDDTTIRLINTIHHKFGDPNGRHTT